MMGVRELKKKQKYLDFITVAAKLFYEQGVANTTMQEIADMTGAGLKTLNRYFPTRNMLILAILKEDDRLAIQRVNVVTKRNYDDPIKWVHNVIEAYVDYSDIINNIEVWREYEAVRISEYNNEQDNFEARELRQDFVSIIYGIVKRCVDDGLLKDSAPSDSIAKAIHAFALLNFHLTIRGEFNSADAALQNLHEGIAFAMHAYLNGSKNSESVLNLT